VSESGANLFVAESAVALALLNHKFAFGRPDMIVSFDVARHLDLLVLSLLKLTMTGLRRGLKKRKKKDDDKNVSVQSKSKTKLREERHRSFLDLPSHCHLK